MIRQAFNQVEIEGILSEINLDYKSYTDASGKTVEAIGGDVKVRVRQVINKGEEPATLEIPVFMFSQKFKKDGTPNASYASIQDIKENFTSINMAGGENGADGIRFVGKYCSLEMNEFYNQKGQLVSYPRVKASFASKVERTKVKEKANFTVELMVSDMIEEEINDEATGRLIVVGSVPQYGGKVDVIKFIASNEGVVSGIQQMWAEADTVKASGKLNFTSRTETYIPEVALGEAEEQTRTISVSELIITGGTEAYDQNAFELEDVRQGLTERKSRLEAQKEKDKSGAKTRKTPAATSLKDDFGF
jgi:hypothetical protein